MSDTQRFIIFIAAAFVVFIAVLRFSVRNRANKPPLRHTYAVGIVVVIIGMCFARYTHLALPNLSWLVYYGVPALTTVFLPPLWLRMSRRETAWYLPLAWLTAPAIHLFFSYFVGWHDYMPFPIRIPSFTELLSHSVH